MNVYAYEIDSHDRIVAVDDEWLHFAEQNDAPHLTRDVVMGKSLYGFMSGEELIDAYERIFSGLRARSLSEPLRIPFRCDSHDRKRVMELLIKPSGNKSLMLCGVLREETLRRSVPVMNFRLPRDRSTVMPICSRCRKVCPSRGVWQEVEDAFADPYALPPQGVPTLSEDLCPDCNRTLQWFQHYLGST